MSKRSAFILLFLFFTIQGLPAMRAGAGDAPSLEPSQVPPKLVYLAPVEYPESARQAGCEGRVRVLVSIDRDGSVRSASLPEQAAVPVCPELEEAALKAARACLFEPAGESEETLPFKAVIPFSFKLN